MSTIREMPLDNQVVAVEQERNARVALLLETPQPGLHLARDKVLVIQGKGFAGDHDQKSYYKGDLVPGREVTAVSLEILQSLGIDPVVVGDNLITEGIDLVVLETGGQIRIGEVVLERSPREHRPCMLFQERTSPEAFAAISQGRNRGALFTVIHGGEIRQGDSIEVL